MSSRGRALQDVQPAEKPRYLLPCKDKARLYTPPGGTYAVVRDSEEFLDAMRQRGGDSRLIRVSDETSYLEILEPFVVPADMNVTIDCQGSVIDLQPPPSVPGESSVLNLYDCCVLGYPVGAPYLSETGVVSDTTLIGKCADEQRSGNFFQQQLINTGTPGVHYEDQEILGGDFVWRNVSGTCPSVADIIEEIELLETPTRTAPGPESTAVQTGGGGGAAVAAWVIMLLIISGVALMAMMCLCCVLYFVVRRRRREGLRVEICSKSGDNLSRNDVFGAFTRYAESSENRIVLLSERSKTEPNEASLANQSIQNLSLNLHTERNSSSTSVGAVGWQIEPEISPVSGERISGGVRKLSDEQPLRMDLHTPISGSSIGNPHAPMSGGSIGGPHSGGAPHSGGSIGKDHAWIRTAPAATTASAAVDDAAAAPSSGGGGDSGSDAVRGGGRSFNMWNRASPPVVIHPHHLGGPPTGPGTDSATRYSKQTSNPEAAYSREDHQNPYNRTTGAQYHDVVKFTGTSGRRSNPHMTHLSSSNSAAPLNSINTGSSLGVGGVNSVGSGGISPPHKHTHLHHVAPINAPKNVVINRADGSELQMSGGSLASLASVTPTDARLAQLDATHTSHGGESVCSPRSAAASLFTTTRSKHIPHEHMALLQRLPIRGPNVWRASWKDVPTTVQDFTFEIRGVADGDVATDTAAVFAGAVIAANLSHSHVINTFVHEVSQELDRTGTFYNLRLVQELCLGGSLAELMSAGGLLTPEGGIQIHPLLTVLRHVASGLVHLHRLDLTCGDLDPSQILLYLPEATGAQQAAALSRKHWAPDSLNAAQKITTGECKAKLGNFGWSHAPCTKCQRVMPKNWNPTTAYWCPERRSSGICGRPEFHVYSFGCILWELYCGLEARLDPGSEPHPELGRFPGSTPIGYVLLTTSCLAPDPADRPTMESVVQVLTDLEAEIRSKYYTDLCGTPQKVDRLAYKLDRKTLMNPDFAMNSYCDMNLPPPARANSGQPHSPSSNKSGETGPPGSEGATGPDTGGSPRIPLPKSVTAILHSFISHHPPEQ